MEANILLFLNKLFGHFNFFYEVLPSVAFNNPYAKFHYGKKILFASLEYHGQYHACNILQEKV